MNRFTSLDDVILDIDYILESLILLRNLEESGDCNHCGNKECEWKPKTGQLIRYNCPHYVKCDFSHPIRG